VIKATVPSTQKMESRQAFRFFSIGDDFITAVRGKIIEGSSVLFLLIEEAHRRKGQLDQ